MKTPNVLMKIILGAAMISSCDRHDSLVNNSSERDEMVPVQFSSHIVDNEIDTKTSKDENQTITLWNMNDEIGIYMLPIAPTPPTSLVENMPYVATNTGKLTDFKAKTMEIFFPRSAKSLVDFIAYYPYDASIKDNMYNLNISKQDDQSKIDLLYSRVNGKSRSAEPVVLKFNHMLSNLIVNIVLENGHKLENITARVYGMSPSASIDLLIGSLNPMKIPKESLPSSVIYPKIMDNGCSVLFFPEEGAPVFQFTINTNLVQGTKLEWKLPQMKFEAGKQYVYTLQIGINGIESNGEIHDWVVSDIGKESLTLY